MALRHSISDEMVILAIYSFEKTIPIMWPRIKWMKCNTQQAFLVWAVETTPRWLKCTVSAASRLCQLYVLMHNFTTANTFDKHTFYPTIDRKVFIRIVGAFRSPKSMSRTCVTGFNFNVIVIIFIVNRSHSEAPFNAYNMEVQVYISRSLMEPLELS